MIFRSREHVIDEARRHPGIYDVWVMDATGAIRLVFGDEPPIRLLFENLSRIGSCSAVTMRFIRSAGARAPTLGCTES